MLKKILIGIAVLIVAVVGGVVYVASNAGDLVKAAVEEHGSRATQVNVTLDAVDIELGEKSAGMRGLTVGNPAGFKTDSAIKLGEISVKLHEDWSPDVVVVEEIMVNGPEVTYEIGSGGSNISKIQENVDNFVKAMSGPEDKGASEEKAEASGAAGEEEGPKVIINNFYIKNGKVNVSATLFEGKTLTTPLPDIHLTDIGKDDPDGGASPAEVVEQLISAITDKAGGAASGVDLSQLGLSDISGKAAEVGKAATDAVKGAAENLGDAGGEVGKKLEGAGDSIGGAVKGLFGN
ncbi:hypothetical protein V5T82_06460 [Magnetovibrio sp. PR-2]|uniref:hypothetical protein n=1 Tax=Magnetovibrio sp. PR-2 TaxID=3120356 RepID=UPI002FCE5030